jgi:hypothetical protein
MLAVPRAIVVRLAHPPDVAAAGAFDCTPGETLLGPLPHRSASSRDLGCYLGGCLSSSSILALNTSPSFSSSVSPRLLPGPVEVACCVLVLVAGLAGGAAVAAVPPELGSGVGVFAPPLLPGRVREAVLARLLFLLAGGSSLALQLREVWPELLLASDFVLVFAFLPADEELGLSSSSSRDLVVVEGLIGLEVCSRDLFSVGALCCC